MLGNKRHCDKGNSAYIVYVNPQDQQMKTLEVCSNKSEFVIGRGMISDLVISNPIVSRKHCIIKNDENGDWILFDKSSSGVYVNKERVSSSRALCDEDTITITGPYNYPLYFYTSEPCQKKKKKLMTDILSDVNKRTKARKEANLKEKKNSSVILLSSEEDDPSAIVNATNDVSGIIVDKFLIGNNAKAVAKEGVSNEEETSSLRSKLEKLMDEKSKLKEQNAKAAEQYSKHVHDLKLEIQVAEIRNKLSNETIESLKSELGDMKASLLEKDNELKMVEARLFVAEENQVKKEDVKNEVMLKVKEDMMELLENELQCSICNEIIIEATVLNCTHLFCNLCIHTWMKKKKECAVCRTQVKEVVKSRAVDSFIEKILLKFSSPEQSEHRKQVVEDRKKESIVKTGRHRQARNNRLVREAAGRPNQIQQPYLMAIQPPGNVVRMMNRIGAYFPEMEHLRDDIADDFNEIIADNELMNELFPIINLTNDAIDLRINRRLRRARRGQPVRFHGRDVVIDLRDSPERD